MRAAREYFEPKNIDGALYVNAGKLQKLIQKKNGIEPKATIADIVINLNLNHKVIGKAKSQKIIKNATVNDGYNCRAHYAYLDYNQLLAFDDIKQSIKEAYENDPDCLETIEDQLSDNNTNVAIKVTKLDDNNPATTIKQSDIDMATMLYYKGKECPILTISDNEKFTDKNGNAFDIEIRGEHTLDGILFKAEDIANIFGMESLTHTIHNKDKYVENKHYMILDSSSSFWNEDESKDESAIKTDSSLHQRCLDQPEDKSAIKTDSSPSQRLKDQPEDESTKNRRTFLSWGGLLKVLFTSKSGNSERQRMVNWIVKTMFIHQFGSESERNELATNLTKSFRGLLNSKAGVYLVRIGKVKDLRGSMNISKDSHPDDNAYLYKFGKSNDCIRRFSEHTSKSGYGCYSNSISMNTFVFMDESKITKVENELHAYFNNLKHTFTDIAGKSHNELVVLTTIDLKQAKEKYDHLLAIHGNKNDSQIANSIEQIKDTYELQLLQKDNEILELKKAIEIKDMIIDHKDMIYEKDISHKDITHAQAIEILNLKLTIATMK
mgnify:CR=1 FL=1